MGALATSAQPMTARHNTLLTREVQARFCEQLALHGNVRGAARAVGVSRANVYRLKWACPQFAALWTGALVLARAQAEEVLADRALNGVEETVYYRGEEVATRRRFDTRLLLAHLARLDLLAEGEEAEDAAMFFDIGLAELRAEGERAEDEDKAGDEENAGRAPADEAGAEAGVEDAASIGVTDADMEEFLASQPFSDDWRDYRGGGPAMARETGGSG